MPLYANNSETGNTQQVNSTTCMTPKGDIIGRVDISSRGRLVRINLFKVRNR